MAEALGCRLSALGRWDREPRADSREPVESAPWLHPILLRNRHQLLLHVVAAEARADLFDLGQLPFFEREAVRLQGVVRVLDQAAAERRVLHRAADHGADHLVSHSSPPPRKRANDRPGTFAVAGASHWGFFRRPVRLAPRANMSDFSSRRALFFTLVLL